MIVSPHSHIVQFGQGLGRGQCSAPFHHSTIRFSPITSSVDNQFGRRERLTGRAKHQSCTVLTNRSPAARNTEHRTRQNGGAGRGEPVLLRRQNRGGEHRRMGLHPLHRERAGADGGNPNRRSADAPRVLRFIRLGGEPYLVRYNSRMPLLVYVPAGAGARYRNLGGGVRPEARARGLNAEFWWLTRPPDMA